MNIQETTLKLATNLKVAATGISQQEKNQVCTNLIINPATFNRYTSGSLEGRKLVFAERLLSEIKKVRLAYKQAQQHFKTAATA